MEGWVGLGWLVGYNTSLVTAVLPPPGQRCGTVCYHVLSSGYDLQLYNFVHCSLSTANFHLRNGAVLWRLNWLADTSARGLAMSCTIMANYRYHPDDIDDNSRRYAENQLLSASDHVLDLVRQLPVPAAATSVAAGPRRPRESTASNPVVTRWNWTRQ